VNYIPRLRTGTRTYVFTYRAYLLTELGDAVREPRHFPAGIVLVYDAAPCRPHDDRLGCLERRQSCVAVATLDGFLNFAYRMSQQRTPRLVHLGPARDDARCFAGGLRIGHQSLIRSWCLRRISAKATKICKKLRRRITSPPWLRLIVTLHAGVNARKRLPQATRFALTASCPAMTEARSAAENGASGGLTRARPASPCI
jgi:hypothetical protein